MISLAADDNVRRDPVALVAMFHVARNRRLDLFSLTVLTNESDRGGREWVMRTEYDVDLSKKWGYIFDQSGGGGGRTAEVSGVYFAYGNIEIIERPTSLVSGADSPPWTAPETLAIRERNRTRRLKRLPRKFGGYGRNILAWLEANGIQQGSVYCSECGDWMPDDCLCEHCWWCEEIRWYSTPGERCGCTDRRMCDGEEAPKTETALAASGVRFDGVEVNGGE